MIVERLELVDFRNYSRATFELTDGLTVVVGGNGQGKTNFAEALAYLATLSSFRAAPPEALVRVGANTAVIRADVRDEDGRRSLIEAEVVAGGRNRVQINRQRLGRARDLLGTVRVTVFSPDDLTLVKGGPADRRRFLDDALVALAVKYDAARLELERIVRQRNTLLRQAGGRLDAATAPTLDVWDARLTSAGEQFGTARASLIERIVPHVGEAYERLAGRPTTLQLRYDPAWRRSGLAAALAAARSDDLRRGVSTVGPHRDDVVLSIDELPARTHASQGEQRTLALALRLGAHRLIAEHTGASPVLVLDDVLSELDPERAAALLDGLPPGQIVITTAGHLPPGPAEQRRVRITGGQVADQPVADEQGAPLGAPCV